MTFVDTNYFLRFLLADVDEQHQKAKKLFEDAASGKVKLFTSTIVFFEIYWVLASFYEKDKKQLTKILSDLLLMSFVKLIERDLLKQALEVFTKSNLDLEDSFNLVYAKKKKARIFKTFDKKLGKKWETISC